MPVCEAWTKRSVISVSGHPPVIKVTLYRLLNTTIVLGVGTGKFILAMQGHSISPTILDWVFGALYVVVTYWIGFLEGVRPPVWPWFFSEDYVTPCARRLFSLVVEFCRRRWESLKKNWKELLLSYLAIILIVPIISELSLVQHWPTIAGLLLGLFCGIISNIFIVAVHFAFAKFRISRP